MIYQKSLRKVQWEDFNQWLVFDQKLSNKPSTISPRKYRFLQLKNYFEKKPFSRDTLSNYLAHRRIIGDSNNVLNLHISTSKQVGKYLKLKGFDNLVFFRRTRSRKKEPLSWIDMQKIASLKIDYRKRNGLDTFEQNLRHYCLITLLSETGCRISEALTLKWTEVDLGKRVITFLDTKNGEDREVIISPNLSQSLKKMPFQGLDVFNISLTYADYDLRRRAKILGINKAVSSRTFRVSVITNLLLSGAPIALIQEMVGHKNINTTASYFNSKLDDIETMLYSLSGIWQKQLEPKTFLIKAVDILSRFIVNSRFKIETGEDKSYYLIKIPKNAFISSAPS